MPWQTVPVLHISPEALTAKVLCRRHNEALSPLDSEALRTFEALRSAREHATRRSLSMRSSGAIVSGEAMELWAMKTMAGLCASGMDFQFGEHRLSDFKLPTMEIANVLTDAKPSSVLSLEIPAEAEAHEERLGRSAVTILWDVDIEARQLTAMIVRMQGLALKFHLKPTGTAQEGHDPVRPHVLDLVGPKRKARIYFSWPDTKPGRYTFIRLKKVTPTAEDSRAAFS